MASCNKRPCLMYSADETRAMVDRDPENEQESDIDSNTGGLSSDEEF